MTLSSLGESHTVKGEKNDYSELTVIRKSDGLSLVRSCTKALIPWQSAGICGPYGTNPFHGGSHTVAL